jgi:L-ascorbate metabolism protein UlaG (beta-lactamase superfamily)
MAEGDTIESAAGPIVVHPVDHASMVLEFGGKAIYVDAVGGKDRYAGLRPPDAFLITHVHGDHFDLPTIEGVLGDRTVPFLTNYEIPEKLPERLKAQTTVLRNGESGELLGIEVEAIPAYNTTPDRQKYHLRGVGNGYVLSFGGKRVYVAGDGEDTPEMRSLQNIDVAFLPMNQPYTMTIDQVLAAVAAFKPRIVYPIHYKGTDPAQLVSRMPSDGGVEVRLREWYPAW